jgi:hypothetical protein
MMQNQYSGRRANSRPINLTPDAEAVEILDTMTSSHKSKGWFVSRLLYEHKAREEERRRLQTEVRVDEA